MKFLWVFFLCCALSSCARQVKFSDKASFNEKQIKPIPIEKPLKELKEGEKLIYAVDWIGIPAGIITLEVKDKVTIENAPAYHIVAKALPNKFFRFFHNVEYNVDSYIDINSMKSVKFRKERSLNGRITREETVFDYKNNEVTWHYFNSGSIKRIKIPENNQDLLSALYAFRVEEVKLGEAFNINIVYAGKAWPIRISLEREEEIQIPGCGAFRVILGKVSSRLSSHITGFNNIEVFISLDKNRLPVMFRMRTKIGYLSGILSSQ